VYLVIVFLSVILTMLLLSSKLNLAPTRGRAHRRAHENLNISGMTCNLLDLNKNN
jgi:hypothetical protein